MMLKNMKDVLRTSIFFSFVGDTSSVKLWFYIFSCFCLLFQYLMDLSLVAFWHLWPMSVWAEIFAFLTAGWHTLAMPLELSVTAFPSLLLFLLDLSRPRNSQQDKDILFFCLLPFPLKGMNVFVLPGECSRITSAHTSSFILQGIFPQNPSQPSSEQGQLCSSKIHILCLSTNLQDPKVHKAVITAVRTITDWGTTKQDFLVWEHNSSSSSLWLECIKNVGGGSAPGIPGTSCHMNWHVSCWIVLPVRLQFKAHLPSLLPHVHKYFYLHVNAAAQNTSKSSYLLQAHGLFLNYYIPDHDL